MADAAEEPDAAAPGDRRDRALDQPGHPVRAHRTEDYKLRGQTIKKGESLALFYPSANRDEDVFEDPFKFDITRNPNPHIAFGIGEHFCLGANIARLELEVIFRELMKRVEYIESNGPLERLRSGFVGGIKHMPVRINLRPRAL